MDSRLPHAHSTTTSSSGSQRIDPGSSFGWLSIRSASASNPESLYHVPLSFVHSIVVFHASTRSSAQARLRATATPMGGAHSALSSPVSVQGNVMSQSVHARLEQELRGGAGGANGHNSADGFPQYPTPAHSTRPTPSNFGSYGPPVAMGGGGLPSARPSPSVAGGALSSRRAPSRFSFLGVGATTGPDTMKDDEDPALEPLRTRSILLRVPKRYDVWLVFPDLRTRASFVLECQAACARVGGRQLQQSGANHLIIRQAVFSASLLGLDHSVAKTTQVRSAELQRFFQHLISSSITRLPTSKEEPVKDQTTAAASTPAVASAAPPRTSPVVTPAHHNGRTHQSIGIEMVQIEASGGSAPSSAVVTPIAKPNLLLVPSAHQTTLEASAADPHGLAPTTAYPLSARHASPTPVSRSRQFSRLGAAAAAAASNHADTVQHAPLADAMQALSLDIDQAEALLDMECTLAEFAEALDLEVDHTFPRSIFAMADRQRTGLVSFRELERVLLTLSNGAQPAKLRMLFDLYDISGKGFLEFEELSNMLRESLRAAEEYDSPDREARVEQEVTEAVVEMYRKIDCMVGDPVDFQDFQIMMTAQPQSEGASPIEEEQNSPTAPPVSAAAAAATPSALRSTTIKPSMLSRLLQRTPNAAAAGSPKSKNKKEKQTKRDQAAADEVRSPQTDHSSSSSVASPGLPHKLTNPSSNAGGKGGHTLAAPRKPHHRQNSSFSSNGDLGTAPRQLERMDSCVMKGGASRGGGASDPTNAGGMFHSPIKRSRKDRLRTWINTYRSQIFILVLFYLATLGIFFERFWTFAAQTEHVGIRRIVGWSVPITRGPPAASHSHSPSCYSPCARILSPTFKLHAQRGSSHSRKRSLSTSL